MGIDGCCSIDFLDCCCRLWCLCSI